jgi:hypothetical protein
MYHDIFEHFNYFNYIITFEFFNNMYAVILTIRSVYEIVIYMDGELKEEIRICVKVELYLTARDY